MAIQSDSDNISDYFKHSLDEKTPLFNPLPTKLFFIRYVPMTDMGL